MVHYKSILKVIWEQKLDYFCSKILHIKFRGGRACWPPPPPLPNGSRTEAPTKSPPDISPLGQKPPRL